jgi:hypothetical protein
MALGKTVYRLLVQADIPAIANGPADIAMGNLQWPGCLADGAARKRGRVYIQHLRHFVAGPKHGVIGSQQVGGAFLCREQQCVTSSLQHIRQGIKTAVPEHQVAVGKPDPVCLRCQRRTVAADTPSKQCLFRDRLPVPGDTGHRLFLEKSEQLNCFGVLRAEKNRHGDVKFGRRKQRQRTQLIHQKMRVVPAVTHHFELEMACASSSVLFWRQIRFEPLRRNPAAGGKPEKR